MFRAPEMLADPHFAAREAIVSVDHPHFGKLAMQNVAPKLSDTPGRVRHAGPELGEHNDEVYRGLLKMSTAELKRLAEMRAI
jgi:formyl-CoA transferase